ncbi:MAG TPA: glycoside hydrolase family 88 protein [Candidatus Angelobacter sp.]|nr:glycoside hydrolase family 88 protein [Candidatus Angelobacter sp.]
MRSLFKLAAIALLVPATVAALQAQQDYFGNLPPGDSPQAVGKAVAQHFVTSPHQGNGTIFYGEDGTWYGALTVSQLTHDDGLRDDLIKRFEPLMPGGAEANKIPRRDHVDDMIFGIVPLEIYRQTHDKKYLDFGLSFADRQWDNPLPNGLSHETRYWIDDMYMLTIVQLQAYRATGDAKYIDRSAKEMVAYLDKLQRPNGLFYHAPDVPYYWGRGNGWVAAGMTEMLRSLPANHPLRPRILRSYRKMMAALVKYQTSDGMWRQLIVDPQAWEETSGSGMFTYALITGVKNGWLPVEKYGPAARKAWIALVGFIDQNENVTNVCEGTNKKDNKEYYLQRKRRTGDFHAQETVLWSASALLRSPQSEAAGK